MLIIKYGDVFEELKEGDVFVHGCNARGVMGSGIAKVIKERFPAVYERYKKSDKKLGSITTLVIDGVRYVNAITQDNYGRDKNKVYVDYIAVEKALSRVVESCQLFGYNRVVFPFIGAGLANGDKDRLLEIFFRVFENDVFNQPYVDGVLVLQGGQ